MKKLTKHYSVAEFLRNDPRGGSRTAATSKMERFVIIVNGLQALTIITKRSILDNSAVLDPPLDPKNDTKEISYYLFESKVELYTQKR